MDKDLLEYSVSLLNPAKDDIIVIKMHKNYIGKHKLETRLKLLKEKFPNNAILILDNDIDINTIKSKDFIKRYLKINRRNKYGTKLFRVRFRI